MLTSNYETKVLSQYDTKIRFNQDIHGRKAGAVENVKTSKSGAVLDPLLRRRIKDDDGSVTILRAEKKEKVSPQSATTSKKDIKSPNKEKK